MRFRNPLKSFFNDLQETGSGCLVNYIWINEKADAPAREIPCTVSLKHIDYAYANAARYPQARVRIWIDFSKTDALTQKHLYEHYNTYAPANVAFCDLNDIGGYKHSPVFHNRNGKDTMKGLWARVDYARLLVLEHVLKKEPEPYVIYADLDVPDLKLYQAKDKMSKYGIALGTTGAHGHSLIDALDPLNYGIVENGYIGFRKADCYQHLHELIKETFKKTQRDIDGFCAFSNMSLRLAASMNCSERDLAVPHVLFRSRHKIPDKPRYRHLNG